MTTREADQLKKEERARGRKEKADSFWGAFLLTENGKVKSTLLLNSFCLSIVFCAIYAGAFIVLVDPLHALMSGAPVFWVNLVEALVPAAAGTAVCSVSWLIFKEKRMMPASFGWLLALAAACFVTMLILLRGEAAEARVLFLQFFLLFGPAPVLMGGGVSVLLYRRCWKRRPPAAAAESWKRQ